MTDEPPIGEDFIALLDEQAKSLLQRLKDESSLDGEQRLTVQDHVRGFAAVTNYVETRQKIAPPERGKSRIEEMRDKLSGPPEPRARRLPRPNGRATGGGAGPGAPDAPPPFDDPPPV